MRIKDLHKIELPREKLAKYGQEKLADFELLAILLGSGTRGANVLTLSRQILKLVHTQGAQHITLDNLKKIKGLGPAKAAQVLAVIALATRFHQEGEAEVLSAKDIWNLCADFRSSKKEHLVAFYSNTQSRLIERQIISIGILDSSLVHPREVFEPALRLSAASIIIAHNHPSGGMIPSVEDVEITQRLCSVGKIVGIPVVDHIIVDNKNYISIIDTIDI